MLYYFVQIALFAYSELYSGAMTFSITTLSLMGLFQMLSINDVQHKCQQPNGIRYRVLLCWVSLCWVSQLFKCYAECLYVKCRYDQCRVMLNVIMLNVVAPFMYMLIINESISWQNVLVQCHFPDLTSYNINILKANVMSCRLMGVEVIWTWRLGETCGKG